MHISLDNIDRHQKTLRCPNCGWTDVRRSMPHGLLDYFIRIAGLVPYRCRTCAGRFYRTLRRNSTKLAA